jgi:hypothetical protein
MYGLITGRDSSRYHGGMPGYLLPPILVSRYPLLASYFDSRIIAAIGNGRYMP